MNHQPHPARFRGVAMAVLATIQRADADRWARVAMIARCIPNDADLDDEADVIRALFAARLCAKDFDDCLDDAIERAKWNRERESFDGR